MLNGKLYVETGETNAEPRCGVMDGNIITSATDGENPTADGCTAVFQNDSGEGLTFGEDYSLGPGTCRIVKSVSLSGAAGYTGYTMSQEFEVASN